MAGLFLYQIRVNLLVKLRQSDVLFEVFVGADGGCGGCGEAVRSVAIGGELCCDGAVGGA